MKEFLVLVGVIAVVMGIIVCLEYMWPNILGVMY